MIELWIIGGVVLWLGVLVIAVAVCAAAGRADRQMEPTPIAARRGTRAGPPSEPERAARIERRAPRVRGHVRQL